MKIFKASHLVKKPAEVFAEARKNGAIIQQCRTNGEIIEEFVIIDNELWEVLNEFLDIDWHKELIKKRRGEPLAIKNVK